MSKIDHSLFSAHEHALDEAFGPCPECGSKLCLRHGKTGAFIGCTTYPDCQFTKPLHETETSEIKVIDGSTCPECGHTLSIKKGRYGLFIGCTHFPACHHIEPIKKEDDTKLDCPSCNHGHLVKRTNKYGKTFFACNNYPKCKYLLNFPPVAQHCPECDWPIMTKKIVHGEEVLQCPQKSCGHSLSMKQS